MRKSSTRNKGFEKTLIKDDEIIKYEFSACKNIRPIEKGGFSTVYSAIYEGKKIALKSLDSDEENKEVSKEFIKELKQLLAINSLPNINKFHGITQEYIINYNKQLIPELDNNVHNEDDDLTKVLLKEASALKQRRPSYSSSKTSFDEFWRFFD
ncbi:24928_t:CDS:2 [Gigaspora rosea]|nr:24928_t:CDS:2 [Gigaspora rosea]